ncbi:hypothetical protein YC2023_012660 [Brassica napus]
MDPSNLPSQSSSYVGLLHSQQGSVYHENFPYGSFHSSVNFGESDTFPAFNSQQPEDAPVDAPVDAQAARPRKNVQTDSQTSTNEGFVDVETRPEGVKAAKAKRNTGKGKSMAEIATVWEMKKDDLVRKERLSRLAILDTLLTKLVPLTEREESAKNKLLAELF